MKFMVAWADVLTQNITLRIAVIALGALVLVLGLTTARLSERVPLIVERSCTSQALRVVDSKHTDQEIEAFIREAIPARFDSENDKGKILLSQDEMNFRSKEQEDLSKKGMHQRVFVNSVKLENGRYVVDSDRLIAVGKTRSALSFPLSVELVSDFRTLENPYGLVIKRVSQAETGGINDKN